MGKIKKKQGALTSESISSENPNTKNKHLTKTKQFFYTTFLKFVMV